MLIQYAVLAILCVASLSSCSSGEVAPESSRFRVGATREEVLKKFGEPERTSSLRKTQEHAWGAIEDFWSSVPMDSRVEIWFYQSAGGSEENGTTELYFVDDSDQVDGTAFSPEGVVYKSSGGG